MRHFDVDWREVLDALPAWEALSLRARLDFLQTDPASRMPVLLQARAELQASGLVATATGAARLEALPRFLPLLRVLRGMNAVPVLDPASDSPLLTHYLRAQLDEDELSQFDRVAGGRYSVADVRLVKRLVGSAAWAEKLLALTTARAAAKWESPLLPPGDRARLGAPGVLHALQALVRALVPHPQGVLLRELDALLPEVDAPVRAAALDAGVRYLLIFPTLRDRDTEAVLGLLPPVAKRLGPPPAPPTPVDAEEEFEAPFALADLNAVLVDALTQPLVLRNDGRLYARTLQTLSGRLQPLPGWIQQVLEPGDWTIDEDESQVEPDVLSRLDVALSVIIGRGLVRGGEVDGRRALSGTTAGVAWLARGEGEQLKELLGEIRASPHRNPLRVYERTKEMEFFTARLSYTLPSKLDTRAALEAAFLSLPEVGVVPLDAFLAYHARVANPFVRHGLDRLRKELRNAYDAPTTQDGWEDAWEAILLDFLRLDLVPLGAARLGRTADGRVCVGLAAPGRYLLGATDVLEVAPPAAGEVLVKPDFEIVFMAPAPLLEARLAPVADRIGSGVGALFRLTRASVLRAAEQGMTGDEMVALLEQSSRTGVPANVARQIRDWVRSTRRVALRTMLLIECPDPETAAAVVGLTSGHGDLLTPTIVRLPTHALDRKAFLKKLRAKGIFVAADP